MSADLPGMAKALAGLDPAMAGRVADAAGCLSRAARYRARQNASERPQRA